MRTRSHLEVLMAAELTKLADQVDQKKKEIPTKYLELAEKWSALALIVLGIVIGLAIIFMRGVN